MIMIETHILSILLHLFDERIFIICYLYQYLLVKRIYLQTFDFKRKIHNQVTLHKLIELTLLTKFGMHSRILVT